MTVKEFNDEPLLEMGNKSNGVLLFLFGAVCWTHGLNIHNFVFRNMLVSSPNAVLYKLLFLCNGG
jgi:hypothetical protein